MYRLVLYSINFCASRVGKGCQGDRLIAALSDYGCHTFSTTGTTTLEGMSARVSYPSFSDKYISIRLD